MFLRSPLSITRKFLTRTIQSVKSFFNEATYQRLPKTSPMMPFSCIGCHGLDKTLSERYTELDKFYTDFTNEHVIDNRQDSKSSTSRKCSGHASIACNEDYDQVEECIRDDHNMKKRKMSQRVAPSNTCKSVVTREERRFLVARKLMELKVDVEDAMDIEEVLHHYSHLTSPVYMEIFDQFFVHIYGDLFKQFSRQQIILRPAT